MDRIESSQTASWPRAPPSFSQSTTTQQQQKQKSEIRNQKQAAELFLLSERITDGSNRGIADGQFGQEPLPHSPRAQQHNNIRSRSRIRNHKSETSSLALLLSQHITDGSNRGIADGQLAKSSSLILREHNNNNNNNNNNRRSRSRIIRIRTQNQNSELRIRSREIN
jgi:hypothetical protein